MSEPRSDDLHPVVASLRFSSDFGIAFSFSDRSQTDRVCSELTQVVCTCGLWHQDGDGDDV